MIETRSIPSGPYPAAHDPGAPDLDVLALELAHGAGFTPLRPVTLVRGEGARLWDDHGHAYLDAASAHGVACLGHAHPTVLAALHQQAARLMAASPAFPNDQRARYTTELAAVLPRGMERVFLCNSGTEAVEAALKLARSSTGRTGVVACVRGFHGRTMGALSATWDRRYRQPFEPLVPGFRHVPFGRLDTLREAVDGDTAAVLLEVVQGEGGVRVAPDEFLRAAELLCRERGALLVIDEVQTGFGRTGRMFAVEHAGICPDLLCLAKGIASGFPMGAVGIGERVAAPPHGSHGTTFGGGPLACAVARATLHTLQEERLVERAATLGAWLLARLRRIDSRAVREVRGLGLMIGIDLRQRATPTLQALLERGVVALPAGPTVIRLLPPLVVQRADLEELADTLEELLP